MPTGRQLALAVAVVLTLIGGTAWLWFRSQQAPGSRPNGTQGSLQNNSTPAPEWDDSQGGGNDAGVYFLPIGPKEAERRPALEVWKSLFPGMASDPDTKALLRRLYNDLPVDLVVVPEGAVKTKAAMDRVAGPPAPGFAVVLRVAAERVLHEVGGGDTVGSLGYRRDMRVKRGEKSANVVELDKDGNVVSVAPPHDQAILLLAMNDYLLRTKAGYGAFVTGPDTPQSIRSRFPTHDKEAMRANVDRRIADYLNRYRASEK
jgi:hypothetical protein